METYSTVDVGLSASLSPVGTKFILGGGAERGSARSEEKWGSGGLPLEKFS